MKKQGDQGQIEIEIKKRYLEEHLEEVDGLIRNWRNELSAPAPADYAWQSGAYQPSTEARADDNHILHKHLRSRALWRQHSDWERSVGDFSRLIANVTQIAESEEVKSPYKEKHYREEERNFFLSTAVSSAFARALSWLLGENADLWNYGIHKVKRAYYLSPEGPLRFDVSVIANPVRQDEKAELEEEHWQLIQILAISTKMQQAVKEWRQIKDLEERMKSLVDKALKSKDILYPCRFCRHLWA